MKDTYCFYLILLFNIIVIKQKYYILGDVDSVSILQVTFEDYFTGECGFTQRTLMLICVRIVWSPGWVGCNTFGRCDPSLTRRNPVGDVHVEHVGDKWFKLMKCLGARFA